MADDYAYQQTQLRPKPEGPFGFGSKAAVGFGSRTSQGSGDAGPGGGMGMAFFGSTTTGGGFNFNGGYSDGGGSPGGTNGGSAGGGGGEEGTLPEGSPGSLLRYNGDNWVTITPPPGKESVVVNTASTAGAGNYIQGNQAGGIIYFDGLNWDYLDGTTVGERVLIMRNGQPEWLGAPALGTRVLGSIAGEVQWLETESCDL